MVNHVFSLVYRRLLRKQTGARKRFNTFSFTARVRTFRIHRGPLSLSTDGARTLPALWCFPPYVSRCKVELFATLCKALPQLNALRSLGLEGLRKGFKKVMRS